MCVDRSAAANYYATIVLDDQPIVLKKRELFFHCIVYPFVSIVRTKDVLWASRVLFFDVMSVM